MGVENVLPRIAFMRANIFQLTTFVLLMLSLAIPSPVLGEGTVPTSALRLGEKKPLPPQIIDMSMYDDVIELNCEERPDYMNYAESKLVSIVQIEVDCHCDTKHNQSAPAKKYENLYYTKSRPIGCKHFTAFPIKEHDQVAIFVRSSSGTLSRAEIAACANALVRLCLETSLNKNQVATTRIPNAAMSDLILELEKQHFLKYRDNRDTIETLIPIPLETDLGQREMMCFVPPK